MQPNYLYHVHVQNDGAEAVHGLNLGSVWGQLEPDQVDVVTLESGASIEFRCNDAGEHLFRRRFNQAVTDAGGTPGDIWFGFVGSLPVEE